MTTKKDTKKKSSASKAKAAVTKAKEKLDPIQDEELEEEHDDMHPELEDIKNEDMPDIDGDMEPDIDGDIEFLIDPDNIISDDAGDDDEEGAIALDEGANTDELQKIIKGDFEEAPDPELAEEDDDEEEEEAIEDEASKAKENGTAKATTKEWTCSDCYVKVAPAQFGAPDSPVCPQGQSVCPAIKKFF